MKSYDQDALLDVLKDNINQVIITDAAPASHALAVSNSLATITVAPTDFTIAAGDVSGRKITFTGVPEADGETYDFGSGSANALHLSFYNSTTGRRYLITDLAAAKAVNNGDPIDIPAVDILELRESV